QALCSPTWEHGASAPPLRTSPFHGAGTVTGELLKPVDGGKDPKKEEGRSGQGEPGESWRKLSSFSLSQGDDQEAGARVQRRHWSRALRSGEVPDRLRLSGPRLGQGREHQGKVARQAREGEDVRQEGEHEDGGCPEGLHPEGLHPEGKPGADLEG